MTFPRMTFRGGKPMAAAKATFWKGKKELDGVAVGSSEQDW